MVINIYYQQSWLLKLQRLLDVPIWVAKNRSLTDSTPTRWTSLLQWKWFEDGRIDYYAILQNEICIEMDFESWEQQKYWGKRIEKVFVKKRIQHLMCLSGGKGLHFHSWIDANGVEQVTTWKPIREYLYHYILNEAGVPKEMRGVTYKDPNHKEIVHFPFDLTSVSFSNRHLIRAIGGVKRFAKTVIHQIPDALPTFSFVEYPKKIPIWKVSKKLLMKGNFKNLNGTGNCITCDICTPARCLVVSCENPDWIGCYICKHN